MLLGVLGDIVTPPHAIVCSLAAKHVHLQLEDYYFFRQGSLNLVTTSMPSIVPAIDTTSTCTRSEVPGYYINPVGAARGYEFV